MSNNTWYHVELTTDASASKIYLNGQLINTGSGLDPSIGSNLRIATRYTDSGRFVGNMDHIKFYDYARTPAQIAWDYNRGAPVGWWKFDECQGTTAYDSSGNSNNGNINIGATAPQTTAGTCTSPTNGTGAWYNGASGKYNSSLSFDGVDDYVNASSAGGSFGTGDFSLFAWIKTPNVGTTRQIIDKEGIDPRYYLRVQIGGTLFPLIDDGVTRVNTFVGDVVVDDNQWHHVGVVFDRDGDMTTYVDGGKDRGLDISGANRSMDNNNDLIIGDVSGGTQSFNGLIDDVRIYNYALTPLQIKTLYNDNSAVRFSD